jgi:glycosyltransferase involved in cell wall biosynthesis
VASIGDDLPHLHVLLAGDGPDRDRLVASARALGLEDRVRFAGARRDVANVLAALDVFVLSSDFEGSPLALIEAMAAGKAIVATRVGGVPDLIDDGVHGLLVPPGDPGALGTALLSLARDPARRAALGAAARGRQREELTLDGMIERITMLYERVTRQ